MNTTRVAIIQLPWLGSSEQMAQAYRRLVGDAAQQNADIVCLPEFSLLPYVAGVRDPANFRWAEVRHGGPTDTLMSELAKTHGITIISSIFERLSDVPTTSVNPRDYLDTALIHTPNGVLRYATEKLHIPSGDGYHETDYFVSGNYEATPAPYPVHDLEQLQISTPTCYDQWFPEVARMAAVAGAEYIFYPTAIGAEPTAPDFHSKSAWQMVMRGHAIANGVFVAAANRIGTENGVRFYGGSFIADPGGTILAEAPEDAEAVIVASLEQATFDQWRHLFPLLKQRCPAAYKSLTTPVDKPLDSSHWETLG
ncbi:MAG: nitrilase-related carbon-nitrogen hydrolase [Deinococcota bacterium]